jgi:hypothetical protein
MVPNPSMRSGTAVKRAPVGGSRPRAIRCRVGHQQAERGDEQRGDFGLADISRGDVYPEPVSCQVTAVTEPDGGIEGGTVFSHPFILPGWHLSTGNTLSVLNIDWDRA